MGLSNISLVCPSASIFERPILNSGPLYVALTTPIMNPPLSSKKHFLSSTTLLGMEPVVLLNLLKNTSLRKTKRLLLSNSAPKGPEKIIR